MARKDAPSIFERLQMFMEDEKEPGKVRDVFLTFATFATRFPHRNTGHKLTVTHIEKYSFIKKYLIYFLPFKKWLLLIKNILIILSILAYIYIYICVCVCIFYEFKKLYYVFKTIIKQELIFF